MPNATINSLPVMQVRLQHPRVGNWVAELVVDAETAEQCAVDAIANISLGGGQVTFTGTITASAPYAQNVTLRAVGGANGLGSDCVPRFYQGIGLSAPLQDILGDGGETLSSTVSQDLLATQLPFWTLLQQDVGSAITALTLAGDPDAVWRVLADGTVFLGVDEYPDTALTDYQVIDERPLDRSMLIAAEVPALFPGEMLAGRQVSAVEHVITEQSSRARVWFEI